MIISKIRKLRSVFFAAAIAVTAVVQVGAQGLPGQFVITDRWRYAYSQYSGITNPAFINEENYMSLRFLFSQTLGEFSMQEAGFTMPLGLHEAVGIAWMMQSAGSYEVTNDLGQGQGINVTDNINYFALTYARNVWSGLTVAANANFILQNIPDIPGETAAANTTRIGFGLDFGLTYKVLRHQLLGNHIVGLSMNNLFNMMLDTDESFASALRFSLLSDFWERRIYFGTDFVLKDILTGDGEFVNGKNMPWELTHKVGANILRIFKLYLIGGFSPEGFDHYGFAFGVNMPGFFNGRDIEGMIQFISLGGESDATHLTFSARTELGKHREEIYARNMARRGTLGPNNLYNQALELYHRGEYFRAYWIFSQIAVEYPDFFRSDMVSFYQAACLEGMDMRQSAVTAFRRTKDEHSRSVAVPLADLGLMRVFYRSGDYGAVENQFNELNALGVPDSIKFHAYYLMGQTSIQRGDFARARQLFTMIPEGHPDYVFAYHSAAVANMMDDNIQGAIADLEFVVQMTPANKAQEEIINRSFVFLGLLYYEDLQTEGALARAVTALRRVPRNSYYYQEALLGLGWTALKARQWTDCVSAGQELVRSAQNPILQSEGNLIHAYALAMQRQYAPAVALLEEARNRLSGYSVPTDAELAQNKNAYNSARSDHENMGMKIDELGQSRQSSVVQASIDSLQAPHARSRAAIEQHLRFEDDFKRNTFFARNLEQVQEDIDYALARFTRHAGSGGSRGGSGGSGGAEAIDDELERLRRELEGE